MVGSAALESASQPFQGCATPSQLTPQTLTHDPLLQDEEGTRGYGVFLFLRSNRSLHHSSNDGKDAIRTSFKDSRPVIEHPALTRWAISPSNSEYTIPPTRARPGRALCGRCAPDRPMRGDLRRGCSRYQPQPQLEILQLQ